jgi:hypothetical protein
MTQDFDLPRAVSPSEAQQHLNVNLARFEREGQIAEPVIIHNGEGKSVGALIPLEVYERFLGFYDDPEIGPILDERAARAIAEIGGVPLGIAREIHRRAESGEPISFDEAKELSEAYKAGLLPD